MNGSNFAGSIRWYFRDDTYGTIVDISFWVSGSGMYDKTALRSNDSMIVGTLCLFNPIAYLNKTPSAILVDILQHQAHVEHLKVRLYPDSDSSPNNWQNGIGGANYPYVADDIEDPPAGGLFPFLYTSSNGTQDRFGVSNSPSNVSNCKEIIVRTLMAINRGTDLGLGLDISLYHSGATLIGTRTIDPQPNYTYQYVDCKFEGLNLTKAQLDSLEVLITARRYYTGGSPNPYWRIYRLNLDCFCSVSDVTGIDKTSFTDQDSYFSGQTPAYQLYGDIYGYKFREAMMRILAHAPELLMYLDYRSQLKLARLQRYPDVGSPFEISRNAGNLVSIDKIYTYTERFATVIELAYDSESGHTASGSATKNPDFRTAFNTVISKSSGTSDDEINIERIRLVSADLANRHNAVYLDIWDLLPKAVEITMTPDIMQLEPGDVVKIHEPSYGFNHKKLTLVKKGFNIDSEQGKALLYDIDFTNPATGP